MKGINDSEYEGDGNLEFRPVPQINIIEVIDEKDDKVLRPNAKIANDSLSSMPSIV